MARVITVSSRALGDRVKVTCYVYDTLAEMRRAADSYNGTDNTDTLGVTQARTNEEGRAVSVLIRLAHGHLGTQIVVHEIHHAATALYGATLPDKVDRLDHFTHCNEPFAHLQSDLTCRLVDRLYALGYYGEN